MFLADQLGLDAFGVGEHHRADFAISAPEIVLAAIAGRTDAHPAGSAVTVLSTDDPVRVFQRFSTLNALSNGRAEVILGRGSFTESYPLFGYDLSRYEELFEDKLRPVRRAGEGRTGHLVRNDAVAARPAQTIYPPIETGTLQTWVGVGGSPESVVRAARYGLPLTLAIIGGNPQRFRPYVDLYHQSLEKLGKPTLPIGVHSPGHVAATDDAGDERAVAALRGDDDRIGARARLAAGDARALRPRSRTRRRALRRIARDGGRQDRRTVRALGLSRFNLKYSAGTLPHETLMKSIELIGTQVAPRVREIFAAD